MPYIVDYCIESKHGITYDTAIVFAERECDVNARLEDYIRNFNENYCIYVSDT